jgi:hypothetical protein
MKELISELIEILDGYGVNYDITLRRDFDLGDMIKVSFYREPISQNMVLTRFDDKSVYKFKIMIERYVLEEEVNNEKKI